MTKFIYYSFLSRLKVICEIVTYGVSNMLKFINSVILPLQIFFVCFVLFTFYITKMFFFGGVVSLFVHLCVFTLFAIGSNYVAQVALGLVFLLF